MGGCGCACGCDLLLAPHTLTLGASSDLEAATHIARLMVTKYGMTEAVSQSECIVSKLYQHNYP